MDWDEVRFRAAVEMRKWRSRARAAVRPPAWNRDALAAILAPLASIDSADLASARRAALDRDWVRAHRALAAHFATRASSFPLDTRDVPAAAAAIRARFPAAVSDARERADRIVSGCYDLLGHTSLDFGRPPNWHLDPVRGTQAPLTFWASVPYLDAQCGDHKLVWELNRHQHWLTLGRAYGLTLDRVYYGEFVSQLRHWLAANPPLLGINWASMLEAAFRSLSWLWGIAFFAGAAASGEAEEPWLVDLLVALDRQLTHVEHNLSRYFSPNTHLSGEALALYVAGRSLPELLASRRRSTVGRAVLLQEMERQIAADGGHVELSPHYHRYSTDFYLLALSVARRSADPAAPRLEEAARRQADYLRTIADSNGRLPQIGDDDGGQLFPICRRPPADCRDSLAVAATLLNDSVLRVGPPPEEAFWLCGPAAARPSEEQRHVPSRALPASGYYVSRTTDGDHLVFDAGAHGYLNGGHAHSDALAVTLTLGGRPLLIDPGTATYTVDQEMRDRFRSTAMHNTVVLDGRPQSRSRGPFHWETMASARGSVWRSGEGCDYVEGTHDAYSPLVHTRSVLALHGLGWLIVDHVLGETAADAEASWHLAPGWLAVRGTERTIQLAAGGTRSALASTAPVHILEDECSPVYGVVEPSITLRSLATGPLPLSFATFIAGTAAVAEALSIEPAVLSLPPGAGWHGAAFDVSWSTGSAVVLTSVETEGAPASDDAAPGTLWGTHALRTDARAAGFLMAKGRVTDRLMVNGSRILDAGDMALLELDGRTPLARVSLGSQVAPSVHQAGRFS
jgi:hypothetical protein